MKQYLRRIVIILSVFAFSATACRNSAVAQDALPSNTKIATRPMYTEAVVVALIMGGAIFAVCRSSRRM